MEAVFGPAGNADSFAAAGFRATADAPAWLAQMGLTAYEYQCGRGVRVGTDTAQKIGQAARENGITLSLHAPYFINLSTDDDVQREKNARYVLESLARLPVEVDVASEFRYRNPVLEQNALALIISQSGETADTLAALRLCKERGVRTIGIVNVVGSSIAREADATLYTWAGPEIAVATTKAYSTQLAACYLLATEFARVRGTLAEGQYEHLVAELEALPDKIAKTLADKERIQWFASKYASAKDAFFIGRGLDYAVALEGSLKFKEISYIHSEAFAAGEMKHGPISLIEKGTLVVGILTQPDLFEKSVSNLVEAKSRGAFLMGLTTYGNYSIEDNAGFTVYVPKTDPHFATSLSVIPLQLLAYYVSCAKGLDVDKPRNLAKSVTVE